LRKNDGRNSRPTGSPSGAEEAELPPSITPTRG
jgi:hypothetical protein